LPPAKDDFANLKNSLPAAAEKQSRFEKVKVHAQTKKDPEAVVDEDMHSEDGEGDKKSTPHKVPEGRN
jgi:hypothetical protein